MILSKKRTENGTVKELGYVGGKPTAAQMAGNVKDAFFRVTEAARSGKPLFVDSAEYTKRLMICRKCEYWEPHARVGLGKCTHVKCGCTRFKQKLATESCPIGKWQAVDNH